MSGDASAYGADEQAGVELAIKEINGAGGVNGRELVAIYEDSKCNGKDANTAATKLIEVDQVQFIVGGICSSETLAAAPLAEGAMVALVSPASSSPDITNAGDYIFRTWPSDSGQGKAIAEEIIRRGHTIVGVIYMNSDYNLGLANAFKESFEPLGGVIAGWETYEQDSRDFRTQVAKLRAARPDAIYIIPYSVDGGLIVKQIRQLRMAQPLFGSETMGTKETIEAAGVENIEGLVYATPAFDDTVPKAKEVLIKATQLKGADLSLPVITANAYDATHLIADALKASPGAEPTGSLVRDYLYTVKDYEGAAGTLTIDGNGDAMKGFQVMYIHDGDFFRAPVEQEYPAGEAD